jgi:D-alanyl-D-alanine carboxypeptidase (penicillin-binding protein 5/6)
MDPMTTLHGWSAEGLRGFWWGTLGLAVLAASGPARAQDSRAYIAVDTRTKKILMAKNADERLPVASLAKVVSACVALDWWTATQGDLARLVTVSPRAAAVDGGNPLGLAAGDQISCRDAVASALMGSDAVSIWAVAEAVGLEMWQRDGGKASDAVDFFLRQMNALAASQGMSRSVFVTPHGEDLGRKRTLSTAADMARIGIYASEKPAFNFFVQQTEREVAVYRSGQESRFRIYNTNELLGKVDCDGIKTGRSPRAGDCFLASARRKDDITPLEGNAQLRIPYHIVLVTLGSQDRFGQMAALIPAAFAEYDRWIRGDRSLPKDQVLAMP